MLREMRARGETEAEINLCEVVLAVSLVDDRSTLSL